MARAICPAGLALLMIFEGCRLEAYKDLAGIWTIGYGHTGDDVHPGQSITHDEARALLEQDVDRFCRCVSETIGNARTTDYQFSAMVCLAYNIGCAGFMRSSVAKNHRAGRRAQAADAFLMWNKSAGRVVQGLINRRQAERSLYLTVDRN